MIAKLHKFSISTSVTLLHLGLNVPDAMTHYSPRVKYPTLNAISKYQNLPSMKTISKTKTNCKNQFFLKTSTLDAAENELKRPNFRKHLKRRIYQLKFVKYIFIFSFQLKLSEHVNKIIILFISFNTGRCHPSL